MRKSPFDAVHQQLGANFGSFDGWSLPSDFGDTHSESKALSECCAVIDLCSFGRIQISGNGAKETINRVFNTDKGVVFQDRWAWAKSAQDDLQIDCRIVRLNGTYIFLTKPAQTDTVYQLLETSRNGDITVTNLTDKTAMLGLYGPEAFKSMHGVLPFDIDNLEPGDAARASFLMINFTLLRGSWLNGDGLELICPAAAGPVVAGAVAKYRHKHNITPAGMDSLNRAMQKDPMPL